LIWRGQRVLVTGGGGFIGSHLVERLTELGATVRAFVHYNSLGTWGWLDESAVRDTIEVVAGDITDQDTVRRAVDGCDVVFHLAALIGIPYSYAAPASYVATNICGTLNVLRSVRETSVPKLVHTSTSEVYGSALQVPIAESHPLRGQSPYSASKIGADKMVEAFHASFGVPAVTVRPFNTYGPRQSARAIVPTIIVQCLAGTKVVLGNLTPTRDFNYVEDTVEGFVRAAIVPDAIGKTINLGSSREISIGALAELVGRLMHRKIVLDCAAERIRPEGSEVDRLLADSSLARSLLEWTPAISLEDGLSRTIGWFRENHGRYRNGSYAV
jgi:dTDP-glucose 4,6-dehydratase